MPREHMNTGPRWELRNVVCKDGIIQGEIRNLQKQSNYHRSPHIRAHESKDGKFYRMIQGAQFKVPTFDATDITTWWPFMLNTERRDPRGQSKIKVYAGGERARNRQEEMVDACGPARGSDWWYGRFSWFGRMFGG